VAPLVAYVCANYLLNTVSFLEIHAPSRLWKVTHGAKIAMSAELHGAVFLATNGKKMIPQQKGLGELFFTMLGCLNSARGGPVAEMDG
jgi:hypothetical protein